MNEILPQLHHAHKALDALPLPFLQKILFCLTSTPQFWDECHVFHSTGMAELGGQVRLTLGSLVNLGLEIRKWELTSSLVSKVVIN